MRNSHTRKEGGGREGGREGSLLLWHVHIMERRVLSYLQGFSHPAEYRIPCKLVARGSNPSPAPPLLEGASASTQRDKKGQRTEQETIEQDRLGQDRIGQARPGQAREGQEGAGQGRTRQDRTRGRNKKNVSSDQKLNI